MAGLYDNLSTGGILNAIGDNPVAHYMQEKFPKATSFDPAKAAAGAYVDAVRPGDTQTGAIPAPQDQQQAPQEQQPAGALYPTNPAFNPKGSLPTDNATVVDPNSQAAASQAQAKQNAELDKTKQAVATDTTKGGGVPAPIDMNNPAAALASRNQNIQAGVGHATTGANQPPVPAPLTDAQQKNVILDKTGQESFQSMNTIGDWFHSRSFLMGMMQTGLSLLDGKGYSEAFQTGSKYFDDHYGMEQRTAWADDLLKKGYDRQEIQQYVETGNSKILTSPEQRAFQQQQQQMQMAQQQQGLQMGNLNIQKAQYENDPTRLAQLDQERQEDRVNQRSDRAFTQQYQTAQLQSMNQNNQMRQQELDMRIKAAQSKQDAIESAKDPSQMLNLGPNMSVVKDDKGKIQWNASRNRILVRDNTSGLTHSVPIDPTTADAAAQSAQQTMQNIDEFEKNGHLEYFSMGGEAKKNLKNFFTGGRTQKDWENNIAQLNAAAENAAVDKLIYESPNKPNLAEVHTKAKSLGHLEPGMSQERAEQVIKNWKQFLGTSMAIADAQHQPGQQSLERHKVEQTPPIGTVVQGRTFMGGDPDDGRNWR